MALELLSPEGFRIDGRRPKELRRIRCRLGVFKQADGSAYIEQGNTKVLAVVYGPHEPKQKSSNDTVVINCQYSMATFSTGERKSRPRGDHKSTEKTTHLRQTFQAAILTELYNRSQIDIFVEVLQSDGSDYCASVNAATLAVIDAGIPLRDFVCACSAAYINDHIVLDTNNVEESSGGAELIVSILPKTEGIAYLEMNSRLHEEHLAAVLEVAVKGCKDVYRVLDASVREHITKMSNALSQN